MNEIAVTRGFGCVGSVSHGATHKSVRSKGGMLQNHVVVNATGLGVRGVCIVGRCLRVLNSWPGSDACKVEGEGGEEN
jgi:hypothetical protein